MLFYIYFIMKRTLVVFLIAAGFVCTLALCTKKTKSALGVKQFFAKELGILQQMVADTLLKEVQKGKNSKLMQQHFLSCRMQYKKIEFFAEYFYPTTARLVNGAPIAEIELGENMVDPPGGLQVIEGYLYGDLDKEAQQNLVKEITSMEVALKRMMLLNEGFEITDEQVFDALRLEVFRITALGITGFDTPMGLNIPAETQAALNGIKGALVCYQQGAALSDRFLAAEKFLSGISFAQLNQLDFITDHLQPLNQAISILRNSLKIQPIASESILNAAVSSFFEPNAFNTNALLGNRTLFMSKEKVELGQVLFNDVVLSEAGNRSCASCHHADKAFTDGLKTSETQTKNKFLQRNTPTLTYAGFQNAFFYDLKANTLEDQALNVVHNKDEMHGSLVNAAKRINATNSYKRLVAKAFPNDSVGATPFKIQNALASYVRSLAPFTTRFDAYMRGDKTKLSAIEKQGFNLFAGKAKCATCHFIPLFNGTIPPKFNHTEAEVLGVATKPDTANAKIDTDFGRYALNKFDQYRFAFKTPTLRNIDKTAPYMHNGTYQTLEQVMDFYNRGGGAGIGIHLDNQTLSADPLKLTTQEINAVIAFLKTLNDR